jgi:hypothetical protein
VETTDASAQLTATRRQHWESEQARFEASGLTVREFCRQNNLGVSTFYQRRALLRDLGDQALGERRTTKDKPPVSPIGAGFVDAGVMELRQRKTEGSKTRSVARAPSGSGLRDEEHTALELRLDLGLGVVLTIVRR